MNNYSMIYWLTRLDNIQSLLITLAVISGFYIIMSSLWRMVGCDDEEERIDFDKGFNKWRIASLWIVIISSLILVFMPNKNDMILIYAGGKTMDYVQSDTSLAKIPYQTTQIISDYLDKTLEDIKKK